MSCRTRWTSSPVVGLIRSIEPSALVPVRIAPTSGCPEPAADTAAIGSLVAGVTTNAASHSGMRTLRPKAQPDNVSRQVKGPMGS
jgi:hypothetical protein